MKKLFSVVLVCFLFFPISSFASDKKSPEVNEENLKDILKSKIKGDDAFKRKIGRLMCEARKAFAEGDGEILHKKFFNDLYDSNELLDIFAMLIFASSFSKLHEPFLVQMLNHFSNLTGMQKLFSDERFLYAMSLVNQEIIPKMFSYQVIIEIKKESARKNSKKMKQDFFFGNTKGSFDVPVNINGKTVILCHPNYANITATCVNEKGNLAATVSQNGDIYVWNANAQLKSYIRTGLSNIMRILFHKDGQHLIVKQKEPFNEKGGKYYLVGGSFEFTPLTFAVVSLLKKFKYSVFVSNGSWIEKKINTINKELFCKGYPSKISCEQIENRCGSVSKIDLQY